MVTLFNDPYDCQACRDHQRICQFHIKMYGEPSEHIAFAPGIEVQRSPNTHLFMCIHVLRGRDVEVCSLVDGTTVIYVKEKELA